jgi:hypothetical protein
MAWLSDYHYWALAGLVALIYVCAKGFDQLTNAVVAFHEDYRKVNRLDEWDG